MPLTPRGDFPALKGADAGELALRRLRINAAVCLYAVLQIGPLVGASQCPAI